MSLYRAVFTRQAMEFAVGADDDEFSEIDRWVDKMGLAPSTRGDFTERDEDGRELQVAALEWVVIVYWSDDAVREVRVVRIESLRGGRRG